MLSLRTGARLSSRQIVCKPFCKLRSAVTSVAVCRWLRAGFDDFWPVSKRAPRPALESWLQLVASHSKGSKSRGSGLGWKAAELRENGEFSFLCFSCLLRKLMQWIILSLSSVFKGSKLLILPVGT